MVSATNLVEAQAIEAAGIDIIIAQGYVVLVLHS
jgi:NAD(P)H-dependent flavin oxidoreductase YrpB (nitropropane dioxygenase family)